MFMPAPSDESMEAYRPSRIDGKNEEINEICSVAAYFAGISLAILAIWLPVNRSYPREPVMVERACGPPTASSSARHSAVVEESRQIGESGMEKALLN
jgi:hypothetical protein